MKVIPENAPPPNVTGQSVNKTPMTSGKLHICTILSIRIEGSLIKTSGDFSCTKMIPAPWVVITSCPKPCYPQD